MARFIVPQFIPHRRAENYSCNPHIPEA